MNKHEQQGRTRRRTMKGIARISTAAFLAGVTTLSVTLPMPQGANAGASTARVTSDTVTRQERD